MNILYFTDDRSEYRSGYYYVDWMRAFQANHHVYFWGPDSPRLSDEILGSIELLIIGHGVEDHLITRRRILPRLSDFRRQANGWKSWLEKANCTKVVLSKNDYKLVEQKIKMCKRLKVDMLITHSRQALPHFIDGGITAAWMPFGVDLNVFQNFKQNRTIDIGFRGNLNDGWNGGIRNRLVETTLRECQDLRLDIKTSVNAENFLFGDKYVQWLNQCNLVLNTVSAIRTVGPKWWEAMACGCVPLAPVDEYEELLTPDVHYIAVKPDLSDLKEKVALFMNDSSYRNELFAGIGKMVAQADMSHRFQQLWDLFRQHNLV